jgi:hypothetical protein
MPSLRHVVFRLENVSRHCRPSLLRVPPLIFRFLTSPSSARCWRSTVPTPPPLHSPGTTTLQWTNPSARQRDVEVAQEALGFDLAVDPYHPVIERLQVFKAATQCYLPNAIFEPEQPNNRTTEPHSRFRGIPRKCGRGAGGAAGPGSGRGRTGRSAGAAIPSI